MRGIEKESWTPLEDQQGKEEYASLRVVVGRTLGRRPNKW